MATNSEEALERMRMGFATIQINDEDLAVDFYTNKLGFTLATDFPTPFGGRFLMFAPPGGGTRLVATKPIPGRPSQVGIFTNIAWEVDDVAGTYEALQAKGVKFTQPPTKQPWGGMQALFQDPDGNVFQLNQAGFGG